MRLTARPHACRAALPLQRPDGTEQGAKPPWVLAQPTCCAHQPALPRTACTNLLHISAPACVHARSSTHSHNPHTHTHTPTHTRVCARMWQRQLVHTDTHTSAHTRRHMREGAHTFTRVHTCMQTQGAPRVLWPPLAVLHARLALTQVGSQIPTYDISREFATIRERNEVLRRRVDAVLTDRMSVEQKARAAENKFQEIQNRWGRGWAEGLPRPPKHVQALSAWMRLNASCAPVWALCMPLVGAQRTTRSMLSVRHNARGSGMSCKSCGTREGGRALCCAPPECAERTHLSVRSLRLPVRTQRLPLSTHSAHTHTPFSLRDTCTHAHPCTCARAHVPVAQYGHQAE